MEPTPGSASERWFDLCHRAGVGLGAAVEMGAFLVDAYGEPHRHYHVLAHVEDCLRLAEVAPLAEPERVVAELALWFHDAVYDPRRADNEARSADMARDWMQAQGLPDSGRVHDLVVATAGHEMPAAPDAVACVVHDADLAILGADPDRYAAYVTQIRLEYGWLDDVAFAAGRGRVLRGFLALDRIYALEGFAERFEPRARANLAAELAELG